MRSASSLVKGGPGTNKIPMALKAPPCAGFMAWNKFLAKVGPGLVPTARKAQSIVLE